MWKFFDERARRLGILDTKLAQGAAMCVALILAKLFVQILDSFFLFIRNSLGLVDWRFDHTYCLLACFFGHGVNLSLFIVTGRTGSQKTENSNSKKQNFEVFHHTLLY